MVKIHNSALSTPRFTREKGRCHLPVALVFLQNPPHVFCKSQLNSAQPIPTVTTFNSCLFEHNEEKIDDPYYENTPARQFYSEPLPQPPNSKHVFGSGTKWDGLGSSLFLGLGSSQFRVWLEGMGPTQFSVWLQG